jgi:hypothetical protein
MVSVMVFPWFGSEPRVGDAGRENVHWSLRVSEESLQNNGPKRQFIVEGQGFLATPQ